MTGSCVRLWKDNSASSSFAVRCFFRWYSRSHQNAGNKVTDPKTKQNADLWSHTGLSHLNWGPIWHWRSLCYFSSLRCLTVAPDVENIPEASMSDTIGMGSRANLHLYFNPDGWNSLLRFWKIPSEKQCTSFSDPHLALWLECNTWEAQRSPQ